MGCWIESIRDGGQIGASLWEICRHPQAEARDPWEGEVPEKTDVQARCKARNRGGGNNETSCRWAKQASSNAGYRKWQRKRRNILKSSAVRKSAVSDWPLRKGTWGTVHLRIVRGHEVMVKTIWGEKKMDEGTLFRAFNET